MTVVSRVPICSGELEFGRGCKSDMSVVMMLRSVDCIFDRVR